LQTVQKTQSKVLSFREVYVRYERGEKDVLSHMSFSVNRGDCFGILGGNGVGKTTLLRVIAGQVKPYAGRCKCAVQTAYLSQNPQSMFSFDTVSEEVDGIETERLLDFGMESLLHRHPYDLSGGQQQRLAFLLLLKQNPELLLLDEPTKGLDSYSKDLLLSILSKLRSEGVTVVLVSHDVEFMAKACNRCGLLFDGRLTGMADTRTFLLNNQYYTTMARRLTRGLTADIVTEDELYEI
jgi:energy-coupling factor transport system ATP-binding protein